MTPKVSVIIPVYNPGDSFHKCVKSLLAQTLEKIELIFVLDCPTDGSDKVIEEYALKHRQIIIIKNQYNLNIGRSRNVGLYAAKGDYVAFCDHDDIVKPFMYKEMAELANKTNADIVLGVPEYIYDDSTLNQTYYYPSYNEDLRTKLLSLIIGMDNDESQWAFYISHGVIWDKLYNRSFLLENNIEFVDNNKITFEDNLFNIETLNFAKKISLYNEPVYQHVINGLNTASSYVYSKYDRVSGYINYLFNKLHEYGIFEQYKVRFYNSVVMYITGAFVIEIKRNWSNPVKLFSSIRYLKKNRIIRESFCGCTMRPSSKSIMRRIVLLFINMLFKI